MLKRLVTASLLVTISLPLYAGETEKLHQWLDQQYDDELRFKPTSLTRLGRKELYDQVDDISFQAQADKVEWLVASAGQLQEKFDYDALDANGKVSYDYWLFRASEAEARHKYRYHHYVLDQFQGKHTQPVGFMANYHKVETEQDMLDYIARLSGWAGYILQLQENASIAAAKGIRPPRFAHEFVIEQSRGVISGTPFDETERASSLWADAMAKLDGLVARSVIDEQRAGQLREQVRQALQRDLQPAYEAMIEWVSADLAKADAEPKGVGTLPGGKAFYQAQLDYYTQSGMTPDEIHTLGLAEVERIQGEMRAIMTEVKFDGDLKAFMAYMRDNPDFYYPNTDEGRAQYIAATEGYLDAIARLMPQYFGILPQNGVVVRRVEPYRERDGGAAHYRPGTPDGSRPGVYYLHMSDMSALNIPSMESLAYHEANPGHHMQSTIALERDDLPMFRRNEWFSAYGEGWALYAEAVAREMGAFTDPYKNYGRLNGEIFRAVRLVVDTGLHAKGWSQEQAVEYMLANASYPEPKIRSEVRRYLVAPGQATSYKAGMLRLQAMRAEAQEALGEAFDIRGFHDVILGGGAVPLPLLEQRVRDWVAAQKST